jgi:hypothetical protein
MPKKLSALNVILDLGFLVLGVWWITITARALTDSSENYYFNLAYAVLGSYGGILAILKANEWGWWRSLYGKALISFGSAVIWWSIGGYIWAYYNLTGASEVPFPSNADHFGFAWFYPLTLLAMVFLVKGLGFKYAWSKSSFSKIALLAIPVAAVILTFLLYKDIREEGSFLLNFYKYFYNIGGSLILAASLTILYLSKYFSSGKLRPAIICIVLGLIVQYVADVAFNYRANPQIALYYNADFTDMLYALSLYLVSAGSTLFTLKR